MREGLPDRVVGEIFGLKKILINAGAVLPGLKSG